MAAAPREWNTGTADVTEGAGGVVVNDEGKVLLIRHFNGTWVFPKGHVDPGETPLEAALREVVEEAGVECLCPDPHTTYTTNYVNARGESRRITWYQLSTDAREPQMSEPLFPEGEFVEPSEALERLSFSEDRRLLREVLGVGS
ncbi:MAG TPA: NUDIX domain-containing protein [Trueperaceae bacterium]